MSCGVVEHQCFGVPLQYKPAHAEKETDVNTAAQLKHVSRGEWSLTSPRRPAPGAGPGCDPRAPTCCTWENTYHNPCHVSMTRMFLATFVMHLLFRTYLGGQPFHFNRYSTFPCGVTAFPEWHRAQEVHLRNDVTDKAQTQKIISNVPQCFSIDESYTRSQSSSVTSSDNDLRALS